MIFVILGNDDPGIITWVPNVLTKAKETGLALLDDNSLIDLNVRFPLSNNISIETQVRNLLNKEYFVSANGVSLYVKQASRNFLFTLSVNY